MREILFRGKSNLLGWIEGWYCPEVKWGGYNFPIGITHKSKEGWLEDVVVIPETIGEYTGLTDKKGNRIFEGDIVLYPWNDQDKPERFVIKFKDGQFVASPVKETEDYWDFMVGGYSAEMEVIGNEYDNQDLIR